MACHWPLRTYCLVRKWSTETVQGAGSKERSNLFLIMCQRECTCKGRALPDICYSHVFSDRKFRPYFLLVGFSRVRFVILLISTAFQRRGRATAWVYVLLVKGESSMIFYVSLGCIGFFREFNRVTQPSILCLGQVKS